MPSVLTIPWGNDEKEMALTVLFSLNDGFDRVVTATDAVGGTVVSTYDPASNLIERVASGVVGDAITPTNREGAGNQTLADTINRYDEASRDRIGA